MHPDYPPRETLRERVTRDLAELSAILDQTEARINNLVLERLPNGELAWLRPEPEEEPRYVLTQRGRDDLARAHAMQACFGQPWPSVAEASANG